MIVEELVIRDVIEKFVDEFLPLLDCDGSTRFVSFLLQKKGIDFEIYTGQIRYKDRFFPVHYWIITKNNVLFDFKTEKWIGVTSDKTEYLNAKRIDKDEFLSVGGDASLVLGVLLKYGTL